VAIERELLLRLPNSPGALAEVCRLLSAARVNIRALCLESNGLLRLVVDNPVHAGGVLKEGHHQVVERDVLVVSVSGAAGGVAPAVSLAAGAGVNVDYAYGSAGATNLPAIIVLGVEDAERAATRSGL